MDARRQALEGLLKETRVARMADRLPEERRPRAGLLISIGMAEPDAGMTAGESAAEEIEDEAETL